MERAKTQKAVENVHSSTALDTLAKLLGTVVLVKEVVGDFLKVGEMAVKKRRPNGQEVGVAWVIDLHNTPWVLTCADLAAVDLNDILRADYGKRHKPSELSVLFDGILIVLLDVIWEVVNWNAVVFNVLHHQLLGLGELGRGERVGTANNGDDVDAGRETLHQFDIQLAETASRY